MGTPPPCGPRAHPGLASVQVCSTHLAQLSIACFEPCDLSLEQLQLVLNNIQLRCLAFQLGLELRAGGQRGGSATSRRRRQRREALEQRASWSRAHAVLLRYAECAVASQAFAMCRGAGASPRNHRGPSGCALWGQACGRPADAPNSHWVDIPSPRPFQAQKGTPYRCRSSTNPIDPWRGPCCRNNHTHTRIKAWNRLPSGVHRSVSASIHNVCQLSPPDARVSSD